MKKQNHYANMIPAEVFDKIPKAIFAAIAISYYVNHQCLEGPALTKALLDEWQALFEEDIVPQKPFKVTGESHEPVLMANPNIKTSKDMAELPALIIQDKIKTLITAYCESCETEIDPGRDVELCDSCYENRFCECGAELEDPGIPDFCLKCR